MKKLQALSLSNAAVLISMLLLFVWGLSSANFNYNDTLEPRAAALALINGQSAYPFFGDHIPLGYAPPYIPFFIPLALLPWPIAVTAVVALSATVLVLVLRRWLGVLERINPSWFWVLLASVPVFSAVSGVEISPVIGFGALSLAFWMNQKNKLWWCGFLLLVGLLRTTNAIPVVVAVLAVHWRQPKEWLKILLGMAALAVPLGMIAFTWDRNWITDYLNNLSQLNVPGLPHLVDQLWGKPFIVVLLALVSLFGVLIALRGKEGLNDRRASLVLAITVWCTSVPLQYAGIFALPAIIKTASVKPAGIPALVAFAAGWAGVLLFPNQSYVNDTATLFLPFLAWPLIKLPSSDPH